MKKLTPLILVGLLTFAFGIAIGLRRSVQPPFDRLLKVSGTPCREGLVTVEPQPHVPIRIAISDAACNGPQEARVQFVAENIGTVAISKFEIGGVDTYDRPVDVRKGENMIGSNLYPHHTTTGLIGGSAGTVGAGAPVLKSYQITVWSITYADGKTWTRAALK
jgi:hypothetical protein